MYQREEVLKCNELERDVSGLIQTDTRKKKFKDRSLVIEHFSQLLQNKKITVSRFLCMMSNMDNKIAFEEFEFPALNIDEISFETESDREQFMNTQQSAEKGVNGAHALATRKGAKGTKKTTKTVVNQEVPILTRSKTRKAAARQQKQSNDFVANSSDAFSETNVSDAGKSIAQPSNDLIETLTYGVSTRTRKRCVQETQLDVGSESGEEPTQPIAKRAATINSESRNSEIGVVTELMSSSTQLSQLHTKFNEILNGKINEKMLAEENKSTSCIMKCGRRKATVLLPCKHQPICNQCYVLWRLFVTKKMKNVICPLCKNRVTSNIVVNDD